MKTVFTIAIVFGLNTVAHAQMKNGDPQVGDNSRALVESRRTEGVGGSIHSQREALRAQEMEIGEQRAVAQKDAATMRQMTAKLIELQVRQRQLDAQEMVERARASIQQDQEQLREMVNQVQAQNAELQQLMIETRIRAAQEAVAMEAKLKAIEAQRQKDLEILRLQQGK